MPAAEQQTAEHHRLSIAFDEASMAVDGRRQQPEDVELVSDEARVGEEAQGEAAIGVAHVDDDVADVLAAGDVAQGGFHVRDGLPVDQLEEASVLVIDDHGHELAESAASSTEEVFVEADDGGPGVKALATLQLQLRVEGVVQIAAGAPVGPSHRRQVTEILAGPQEAAPVAFGAAIAFANPRHRLRER